MSDFLKHYHENHKLVKRALMNVSLEHGVLYSQVKHAFVNGEEDVTVEFWRQLYELKPFKSTGVEYCQTCRKFHLGFEKPLIPWSILHHMEPTGQVH